MHTNTNPRPTVPAAPFVRVRTAQGRYTYVRALRMLRHANGRTGSYTVRTLGAHGARHA